MGGDACGIDFENVLLEDEEFPPYLFDVGLDCTADGSEVVEAGTSAVDFEALEDDKSSFKQIVKQFFVLLQHLSIFLFLPSCR